MGFPDEGVCPYIEAVTSINERLSLKQRDALLISKKRPSPLEKGVSFVLIGFGLYLKCSLIRNFIVLFFPLIKR